MNITLRQLRYLDALARSRHFGRAAELAHITQPALSMQIKELEETLGVPLIERRRNAIELTPAGTEIHRRARDVLAAVRDLTDYARHQASTLAGPLSFGIIPSIAPYLLPNALPLLRKRFPDLQLRFRETQTHTLIEELAAGDLDVVLLSLPVRHPDLETLPLFKDRFVYVTRSEIPAGGETERVSHSTIDQSRLLLLEEGHCLRDQALQFCAAARSAIATGAPDLGATSLSTIMQLIANGFGATLLPEMALPAEIGDRDVIVMRFADPEPRREIGLVWRRTSARKNDFILLGQVFAETRPSIRGQSSQA